MDYNEESYKNHFDGSLKFEKENIVRWEKW